MARVCVICGKGPHAGNTVIRRGVAKKKGGVGIKIVRVNLRRFLPNLQRVKARIDGAVRTIRVCTQCIKTGLVTKA